jgi:hypothetical protein
MAKRKSKEVKKHVHRLCEEYGAKEVLQGLGDCLAESSDDCRGFGEKYTAERYLQAMMLVEKARKTLVGGKVE